MNYNETYSIITKKVLNENTGEIENKEFTEVGKAKTIKGGYRRVYKSYDEAVADVISSKKDYIIVTTIRDKFTYMKTEIALVTKDIAEDVGVTQRKVQTIVNKMLKADMLRKVDRLSYVLNPYMYLPFRANAEKLQHDWKETPKYKEPIKW